MDAILDYLHDKRLLLVLGLPFATMGTACAPAAPTPPPATSTDANKALVRQYYEQVLNAGQFSAVGQFVSPSYKRYLSATGAPLTADQQSKRLAGLRAAFPDLKFTIDDMTAEGDRVAIRATVRGTHNGAFQGLQPTDKSVTVAAIETMRLENGKIAEHWGGADNLDLLQQLGAVASPEPAK